MFIGKTLCLREPPRVKHKPNSPRPKRKHKSHVTAQHVCLQRGATLSSPRTLRLVCCLDFLFSFRSILK